MEVYSGLNQDGTPLAMSNVKTYIYIYIYIYISCTQCIVNENNIKTIKTSTHAHTVERFIRTCVDNLYRRLNGLNQDNNEWTKHVDNIINKYNNT